MLVIAHRGYSDKCGDNNIPSFLEAVHYGFDMVEMDIQLCKTGEIIVYHDLTIDNKYIIEADNTWDLRVNDKLFLYITNINDEPISILYFNGNCESQIQFEEPIELSQLDIELRDVYGNLYDFNNLKHTINFQFELTNQFNDIVNIPNNISMVV